MEREERRKTEDRREREIERARKREREREQREREGERKKENSQESRLLTPFLSQLNAGFDATDILNKLRAKHAKDPKGKWFGVDIVNEGICDTFESAVWEPSLIKLNSITAATEAACQIVRGRENRERKRAI
jgi:chaperonin GroEL (HSP60 family)